MYWRYSWSRGRSGTCYCHSRSRSQQGIMCQWTVIIPVILELTCDNEQVYYHTYMRSWERSGTCYCHSCSQQGIMCQYDRNNTWAYLSSSVIITSRCIIIVDALFNRILQWETEICGQRSCQSGRNFCQQPTTFKGTFLKSLFLL